MGITRDLMRRLQYALTNAKLGSELAGVVGITGAFRTDASSGATVLTQGGSQDGMGFNVVAEPGVAGAFKIYLQTAIPIANLSISSLNAFVPKGASDAGDNHYVDVSGYSVANKYVTVRICKKSDNTVDPVASTIISFRISVSFDPAANPL